MKEIDKMTKVIEDKLNYTHPTPQPPQNHEVPYQINHYDPDRKTQLAQKRADLKKKLHIKQNIQSILSKSTDIRFNDLDKYFMVL